MSVTLIQHYGYRKPNTIMFQHHDMNFDLKRKYIKTAQKFILKLLQSFKTLLHLIVCENSCCRTLRGFLLIVVSHNLFYCLFTVEER